MHAERSGSQGEGDAERGDAERGSVGGMTRASATSARTRVHQWVADIAERLRPVLGPYADLLVPLIVGGILALVLAAIAGEVYEAVTDRDGIAGIDRPLLDWVESIRTPGLDTFFNAVSTIAGSVLLPIIAVSAMLILSIHRRSWLPVVLIAATGVGSLLMTAVTKAFVGRNRPPITDAVPPFETSASFPSGHTLNGVAILGVVAYLLILERETTGARVAIALTAAVLTALIAASRVYLGHHWLTDVIAGGALGAGWLAIVITAHRLFLSVREHRRARHRYDGPGGVQLA